MKWPRKPRKECINFAVGWSDWKMAFLHYHVTSVFLRVQLTDYTHACSRRRMCVPSCISNERPAAIKWGRMRENERENRETRELERGPDHPMEWSDWMAMEHESVAHIRNPRSDLSGVRFLSACFYKRMLLQFAICLFFPSSSSSFQRRCSARNAENGEARSTKLLN